MTTPVRGLLFHMTSTENLSSIIERGLLSDDRVQAEGLLETEIGEDRIKAARRSRLVDIEPGGMVSAYVPFYFAARSPMLFAIKSGNVPAYQAGQESIVYLVTQPSTLLAHGCKFVFTDRNAALAFTRFESDLSLIDTIVDWKLMEAKYWRDFEYGTERRMAEFLVRDQVPFGAISEIGVQSDVMAEKVRQILGTIEPMPSVSVIPEWYF